MLNKKSQDEINAFINKTDKGIYANFVTIDLLSIVTEFVKTKEPMQLKGFGHKVGEINNKAVYLNPDLFYDDLNIYEMTEKTKALNLVDHVPLSLIQTAQFKQMY